MLDDLFKRTEHLVQQSVERMLKQMLKPFKRAFRYEATQLGASQFVGLMCSRERTDEWNIRVIVYLKSGLQTNDRRDLDLGAGQEHRSQVRSGQTFSGVVSSAGVGVRLLFRVFFRLCFVCATVREFYRFLRRGIITYKKRWNTRRATCRATCLAICELLLQPTCDTKNCTKNCLVWQRIQGIKGIIKFSISVITYQAFKPGLLKTWLALTSIR